VHSLAGRVRRIVRIEPQDTSPHAAQDQGRGEPGRATADDRDLEGVLADQPFTASSETLLTPYFWLAFRARSEMNS
jgi:hypothetical protein